VSHIHWLKGEAKMIVIIIIIIIIIISPPKIPHLMWSLFNLPSVGQEPQIVKKLILIVSEGRRRRTNLLWLLTQVYRRDTNKETVNNEWHSLHKSTALHIIFLFTLPNKSCTLPPKAFPFTYLPTYSVCTSSCLKKLPMFGRVSTWAPLLIRFSCRFFY
jgi:hypothetical protein